MKNIIKAYLETMCNLYGKDVPLGRFLDLEEIGVNEFILHNPIGEAEQSIIDKIYERARIGFSKYGCTTDFIQKKDRIPHAIEEALDLAIYLTTEVNDR